MRITEETARGMMCSQRTGNADENCIGSLCMAWRWAKTRYKCSKCGAIFEVCYPCHECKTKDHTRHESGYCGLAGVPTE